MSFNVTRLFDTLDGLAAARNISLHLPDADTVLQRIQRQQVCGPISKREREKASFRTPRKRKVDSKKNRRGSVEPLKTFDYA